MYLNSVVKHFELLPCGRYYSTLYELIHIIALGLVKTIAVPFLSALHM